MFFEIQPSNERVEYENFLKIVWYLSNLFSDSDTPYLYYRVAEKIFCRSFWAQDLSRSDVSADAKKGNMWIGLKTFLASNNKSFQKVAEFNWDRSLYSHLPPHDLIIKVAELRNARINFTESTYSLSNSIYHCVLREPGVFKIFEESMDKIDIPNIRNIKANSSSISFNDGIHDYSFLLSKSTLTKRFVTTDILYSFNVPILEDPLQELDHLFSETQELLIQEDARIKETVYLPLYGGNKKVFERSWLNQWNADGRPRNFNEVYVPIPKVVHQKAPDFFPDRNTPFTLKLPNNTEMIVKVCQAWNKALMSRSNKELGQWLLRDVLHLAEWELLTYEKLQMIWIDCVRIDKIDYSHFEINFAKIWTYEKFLLWELDN